jgi:hypothetical protein
LGNPPTESETWFDEYLLTNGYTFDPEFDLGVRTDPDRLIDRAGFEAVCEVKEFTTDAMQRRWPEGGSQFGSFGYQEWFLRVQRSISEAAEQLEPVAGRGWPLVIVFANPHGANVPLSADELIEAMYGELRVSFPLDVETGGPAADPVWTLGEGGRFAKGEAPWISGVATLRRGDYLHEWQNDWVARWKTEHPSSTTADLRELAALWMSEIAPELERARIEEHAPTGTYYYVHLVETASEEAVPIPREIFDAEHDGRWALDREKSHFVRIF